MHRLGSNLVAPRDFHAGLWFNQKVLLIELQELKFSVGIPCTANADRGQRPCGGGAGGCVLGLATWGHCVVDGAWCSGVSLRQVSQLAGTTTTDLHVDLRGCETVRLGLQAVASVTPQTRFAVGFLFHPGLKSSASAYWSTLIV